MSYQFETLSENYTVTSFGNGWAYEIRDNLTGETLWFQDHDADQLQSDTNNFEDDAILQQYFECLCE